MNGVRARRYPCEDGFEKDGQVALLMLLRSASAQHHRQTLHERVRRKPRPLGPP